MIASSRWFTRLLSKSIETNVQYDHELGYWISWGPSWTLIGPWSYYKRIRSYLNLKLPNYQIIFIRHINNDAEEKYLHKGLLNLVLDNM